MSKLFFTADLHLGHGNIIKYCDRPFKDVNHMNRELIRRWNERVKPEDVVIHNGDFCFKTHTDGKGMPVSAKTWEDKLNGKIIFIKGNHDKNNSCRTKIYSLQLKIGGQYIHIVHDPLFANTKYEINITGHVHEKWQCKRIKKGFSFTDCINCGVDVWNFYPVTYDELKKRLWQWRKKL